MRGSFNEDWRCYALISITGAKHLPVFLAKKFQRRPPFFTFSVEPIVIYNCALYIEVYRTVCEIFDF